MPKVTSLATIDRTRIASVVAIAAVSVFIVYGPSAFAELEPDVVGEAVINGEVPYRDFAFEYPPAAVPIFAAPALVTDNATTYRFVFRGLMALSWAGLALLVARRMRQGLASFMLASIVYAFVIDTMFDTVIAVLLLLGYIAARERHVSRSSIWLGVATVLKLAPAVLFALLWKDRSPRTRLTVMIVGSAALAASTLVPIAVASPGGDPISFHRDRLLHAESTLGNAVTTARAITGREPGIVFEHRSQGVEGLGNDWKIASIVLLAIVLLLLSLRADTTAPGTWAAAALAVPAFGPVASPQLFIWPLGFVGSMPRIARALYIGSGAASFIYFMVPTVRSAGILIPSFLLLLRNVMAIGSVVTAARWSRS